MSYYTSNLGTKSFYTQFGDDLVRDYSYAIQKSRIRVIHNVANGPKVDGYLDGKAVLMDVSYKAISDYLEVNAGPHQVTVKVAGTNNAILDGQVNLIPGVSYTLIVHGLIKDITSIAALLLNDNLTCPANGSAHVRFIHAAAGAPAVDIYAGNARVFDNVSYGQVGNPEYLPVPAGDISVSVAVANEMNAGGMVNPVLGPIPLRLVNRGIYTVIASGIVGDQDSPLTALVSEDSKGACIVLSI